MLSAADLVLVGGGHAHLQVLRSWAAARPAGVRLCLVVDDPVSVYSGMVPGLVAGHYAARELEIDLRPLAESAGARWVVARAVGVDAKSHRIELAEGPALPFDVASLGVGSTQAGLELPGVAEHALATRPLARLVRGLEALLERARPTKRLRVAVVGAGAGGVELAFALRARLAREDVRNGAVALLEASPRVLPALSERVSRRVERAARARAIELRLGTAVASVDAESMRLADGSTLPCDAVVWAAGGAAPPWLAGSGLPTDRGGFVRVGPTLALEGFRDLFAAGDCARFEPPLPKAGVHAVRQGPVLAHNLLAALAGGPLRRYRPQRDALALLNLGDGSALGTKWGLTARGRWVLAIKDRIDRRYVRRMRLGC